jgi:cation diffusion facilitator family transporter
MTHDVRTSAPDRSLRERRWAMRLSLTVGLVMLVGKVGAYVLTGSAAILSDAAESVIHVGAVLFAAFSLSLSLRPADPRFPYGYERIAFFSAGFEGGMIVIAALFIIYSAVEKWLGGLQLERLGTGALIVLGAALLNGALGWYLVRVGRRNQSLILEANGQHVLTDSWTSFGVVGGLGLVMLTGWKPFDPLCAIAVALNILWSGGQLMFRSVGGLMDYSNPSVHQEIEARLAEFVEPHGLTFHHLRCRHTGNRVLVEVHLLFPFSLPVGEAHRLATLIEEQLPRRLSFEAQFVTHLEALEDHGDVHAHGAH